MSQGLSTRRRRWLPTLALMSTALVATAVVAATSAAGAPSSTITITGVSPHLVAATTDKQVITLTGTGFDEDDIASVSVAGCTAVTYIAPSSTSLVVKTDDSCAVGANKAVTVTDGAGDTAVSVPTAAGGAQALSFVAPPTIATASASVRPVVTVNTASLAYASQQTSASTSGGTVIKVTAGATPFVNTTATPLAASLGGVALTKIVMATGGGSFTGTLGARAAITNPVLKITSGGVFKNFVYGAGGSGATAGTHDFSYAGVTISVSPASGPSNGTGTLTVTGSGFTTSTAVTIGSATCTKVTQTATTFTCTIPSSTSAGPQLVTATTGSLVSVVSAGSVYTYLAQ